MAEDSVDVWRLFTMPDGKSSMERVPVNLQGEGAAIRSNLFTGKGAQIVSMAPNHEFPWHVGPRRQLVATINGGGEVETGDGRKLTLEPGVVVLIEDLTGKGHVTRIGPGGHMCVFMHLDEDAEVS